ncbi:flagellar basal body P-ring protein FlgI [Gilvimarinus agarilyticus]|uniref:flagellar basal body P-ring protein FlgI n=1 Tax=Gilvimarinus sp. 2_MG-2023 TaxID=3062666 RepID=UPI001C082CEC|nr:flagellar basal body P-ring protein FlgI [Gilvimarinus sp. 2_MG-2023]MBU2887253.1 flagellar basal body P-ring protein FlgI [Gilvimarinus agarilyticus]MDO6571912.1 flagellar basal body P-ring protein FlgI [Gilvimarinus sp. 2_MG-2023]
MKQILTVMICVLISSIAHAERIKDITDVAGVRPNQLIGYGLVVGLDGTGDQTTQSPFTTQSFNNMLKQFGINLPEGSRMQMKNVAAVMLQAELPAFSKPGQKLDVTVNSISNAKSLRGGSLLMSELKGIDGNTYAIAQGSLVVGGFGVDGGDGSNITVNVPSVGRIPGGALVERVVPNNFANGQPIVFNLHNPDFTTANRVAKAINDMLGPEVAMPMDAVSIRVTSPVNPSQRVDFLALLENIEVTPAEEAARVVINSRTGTIVVGQHVRVSPVAITHGSLTVSVSEDFDVSQPNPFSQGETVVTPNSEIDVEEENNPMFKFAPSATLEDIVRSINDVGASPADLMAILEALKQSGALKADLMVI